MVSLFLFYSGFGIYKSINNKGINYIKALPKKGFLLFIKSQIILLIYLIENLLLGIKVSLNQFFLSIIFKSSIGNSNWFAFSIILFYLYSFLSFIFIKNRKYYFYGIFNLSIICFLHSYLVYNYYYPKLCHTVSNTLTFIFGLFYSLLNKSLEKFIMKNDIFFYGTLSFSILSFYNYYNHKFKNVFIISITNAIFSLIIVLISMKIRFNNEFLTLLNSHSFSIYLLQRVVMRLISIKKYFEKNEFIRFFFEFSMILFISIAFDNYTYFIDNIFNIKTRSKNYSFNDYEAIKMINNDIKP